VPAPYIEITRIECDERVRGTGPFVKFVERLAVACRALDRLKHSDVWKRLASDSTSFLLNLEVPARP